MASEIQAASDAEAGPDRKSEETTTSPAIVLGGPKTTVTPRTHSAPRGKIFEDEVRGTVFWEVAECSDDEETGDGEPEKDNKWGNPFRIEWIRWYIYKL